jgi:hypothetical protein
MEQDGDVVTDTVQTTNTHSLTDNCYYVCAAKLRGVSTEKLISQTEQIQIGGGTDINGIRALFREAQLGDTVIACASLMGVHGAVATIPSNANAFAVAFTRPDGTGHMVLALRHPGGASFHDYQMNDAGTDALADIGTGTAFWVFY